MTISGVALLAICTLLGTFIGDVLGVAIGVKANVGGVGIAMLLLIFGRILLARRGLLSKGVKLGVEFWATIYIPIVVAMAAQQNVVAALKGGPVVVIAAVLTVGICFGILALISKMGRAQPESPIVAESGGVLSGRVQEGASR